MPTLETDRLILSPFSFDDAPAVQRLAGDFAIADTTATISHPYPDGAAESWIASNASLWQVKQTLALAIRSKKDETLLGAISLFDILPEHRAELGYWIGQPFWGMGYASEAGHAILAFGFTELKLKRIHAEHLARNPASGRVMEKIGLKQEGVLRQQAIKWGKLEDVVYRGILREEWLGN
ncbi:GNAT family N-acetyltransferase [Iodobacter fluviatilis]|uniref:Ribosomal N-acetyltransferase YdaF n=1 Tax=Iodobacter fluviatilis TaxID=537 RepID=A0A377SSS2_9NEIS|nr:GNAT family N-acetyltransferase [Iodobacter fluviatilis]TCU82219.1 RimJ/RimL family protein N-acetyltransferase [Iodobacter fluviatilis]STR45114.1 Putative ribosomal N-acetyltransferase YdaF [Iodobacter fluviatilis]